MNEKLGRFFIKNRIPIALVILALTGFFLYQARQIKVESRSTDLFPSDHPFVETFTKYKNIFGGASTVVVQLEVIEGDIFNRETLEKIRRITKALELLPAINNYQVTSIAQQKIKHFTFLKEGLAAIPIMWPEVPETDEGIEQVRHDIYVNHHLHGTLVSLDNKAAFIIAGFFAERMDAQKTYERINEILAREKDANTLFSVVGHPIAVGYILTQSPQLARLFLYSILTMIIVLAFYFRDVRGVLVPMATAVISAIWGLGFLGISGHNFDVLMIVVPFMISARAISHSVQLIERYLEEYEQRRDRTAASIATFGSLLRPGVVSIITDAAGVALIWLTPIPLMQKLALMSAFWVLSIVVSDMIFNPILLSLMPSPKQPRTRRAGYTGRILGHVAKWCLGWQRFVVLGVTLLVFGVGFFFARNLVIGDINPGTPMLWPDSACYRP